MNYLTACQTLLWPSKSPDLSNQTCLGYDGKATASQRHVDHLTPQSEQICLALRQGGRTIGTRAIDDRWHNILGACYRSTTIDSSIKEFSMRFSQFKELSETLEFIMYPDVTSFDKLNLPQFSTLESEEFEMRRCDRLAIAPRLSNKQ
ncbi:hypothetical protein TNCV_2618901 [Trichonephila clavipes]|nr:hypothetical protein TNCV_2618901 [Trichonephila clavipes]